MLQFLTCDRNFFTGVFPVPTTKNNNHIQILVPPSVAHGSLCQMKCNSCKIKTLSWKCITLHVFKLKSLIFNFLKIGAEIAQCWAIGQTISGSSPSRVW
jgi:hypothetical protein